MGNTKLPSILQHRFSNTCKSKYISKPKAVYCRCQTKETGNFTAHGRQPISSSLSQTRWGSHLRWFLPNRTVFCLMHCQQQWIKELHSTKEKFTIITIYGHENEHWERVKDPASLSVVIREISFNERAVLWRIKSITNLSRTDLLLAWNCKEDDTMTPHNLLDSLTYCYQNINKFPPPTLCGRSIRFLTNQTNNQEAENGILITLVLILADDWRSTISKSRPIPKHLQNRRIHRWCN